MTIGRPCDRPENSRLRASVEYFDGRAVTTFLDRPLKTHEAETEPDPEWLRSSTSLKFRLVFVAVHAVYRDEMTEMTPPTSLEPDGKSGGGIAEKLWKGRSAKGKVGVVVGGLFAFSLALSAL